MTVLAFKPEIWSKVILAALQKNLVFGGPCVVNSDYEGEISGPGNVVHITQFGDPTISDYTPAPPSTTRHSTTPASTSTSTRPSRSASPSTTSTAGRPPATCSPTSKSELAYKLADTADQYVAGLYTGCATANVLLGNNGSTSSLIASNGLTPAVYSIAPTRRTSTSRSSCR